MMRSRSEAGGVPEQRQTHTKAVTAPVRLAVFCDRRTATVVEIHGHPLRVARRYVINIDHHPRS